MSAPLLFAHPDLEAEAQRIIAPRRELLREFAQQQVTSSGTFAFPAASSDSELWQAFRAVQPSLSPSEYLSLAQSFGFVEQMIDARLHLLHRKNVLHVPGHNPFKKALPHEHSEVVATFTRVRAVMNASQNVTAWVRAFTEQRLFQSDWAAQQAAYDLFSIPSSAANRTRQLVVAWLASDDTVLLNYANYPYINELGLLHATTQEAIRQSWNSSVVTVLLPELRADVVSLVRTLTDHELNKLYQTLVAPMHGLYDESLWHQSPHNAYRSAYQERMPSDFYRIIVYHLAYMRRCDGATAEQILHCYRNQRLTHLVTWRYHQQQEHPRLDLERGRTQRVAEERTVPFPPEARTRVLARLSALQNAADQIGLSLPWQALVGDLPGSKERRRQQRRTLPAAFVQQFADDVAMDIKPAKSLVKNFLVYGMLGLLPIREWETLLHPALWLYLYLHKLGRLEKLVNYPLLTETYNAYAKMLGQPSLHQQLVTGICNHFHKPPYFNSGDGEATAGVPRRKSLKLAGVSRLHEEWIVVPVVLHLELIDASLRPLQTPCTGLCVFDGGSERAITCCVYEGIIGETEVGLTLYDAIWHPHALDMPLRGLPERILVPKLLAPHGLSDICKAAGWIHATVEIMPDIKEWVALHTYVRQSIAALQLLHARPRLSNRQRVPKRQVTAQQAQMEIRQWLHQRDFTGDHRVEAVPRQLRLKNHALPGWDTVAAAYLLPILGKNIPTTRNGVIYRGYFYGSADSNIEPGKSVSIRGLGQHTQRPQGVFVHDDRDDVPVYLPLQERVV